MEDVVHLFEGVNSMKWSPIRTEVCTFKFNGLTQAYDSIHIIH